MFLRDGLPGKELVYAPNITAQFDDRDPLKNAAPVVATFCHWHVYSIGSSKQLRCGWIILWFLAKCKARIVNSTETSWNVINLQ